MTTMWGRDDKVGGDNDVGEGRLGGVGEVEVGR